MDIQDESSARTKHDRANEKLQSAISAADYVIYINTSEVISKETARAIVVGRTISQMTCVGVGEYLFEIGGDFLLLKISGLLASTDFMVASH